MYEFMCSNFLKMNIFYWKSNQQFTSILEDDVDFYEFFLAYSLLVELIDVQPLLKKQGGTMLDRLAYRKRGILVYHEITMRDYFCDNPVYDDV